MLRAVRAVRAARGRGRRQVAAGSGWCRVWGGGGARGEGNSGTAGREGGTRLRGVLKVR